MPTAKAKITTASKTNLPAKSADVKPTEIDMLLADEAFVKIQTIFLSHYQDALLQVAEYIAKTFYDNDIELMRKRKPADYKISSYRQLIKKLQESDASAPKQTWMYNAMGVYVDTITLKKELRKGFHTYENLTISHKVRLRAVKNQEDKKALIKECVANDYSVRQLGDAIAKKKAKKSRKSKKTYRSELKGIKNDLKKRLTVIKKLTTEEKVSFGDVENCLTTTIKKIDEFISELK